jgi:acetyl-CoA carboxylase/biotin carboxylase 1
MVALEVVRPPSVVNGAAKPAEKKKGASVSLVEEYCKALGGTDAIRSILIANNGMAAVKFMRSVRSWAYESFGAERAVLLVAMATPEDMRINAEHIRMADQFVEVPGGTNNNNYANVQLIVEVCGFVTPITPPPAGSHPSSVSVEHFAKASWRAFEGCNLDGSNVGAGMWCEQFCCVSCGFWL